MKRTFLAAALASLALIVMVGADAPARAASDAAKLPFGVVNAAKLYQESTPGKAGVARLEKLQNDAMAKLETMQADLKKAQDAKDDATAERLQVEMQGAVYAFQNALSAEQENVVSNIQAALEKSLEQYRTSRGLSGIFSSETMLSYSPDADVTDGVMELFNKQTVDFGPEPKLEVPAAPAKPDALAPAAATAPAGDAQAPAAAPAKK